MELRAKNAVVTGATGGIGGAIARRLCRAGAHVVATGRDIGRAREAAAAIQRAEGGAHGGRCSGAELDVISGASVEAFVGTAGDLLEGRVDWLVNNAGVAETAPCLAHANQSLLRRLFEVNFYGPLRLFHAFAPGMIERGEGAIVQVASSASLAGYAYVSAYAASKHALLGWTRSAAMECAPKGVSLSAVCPHYVDTPLTDRSIETMREKSGRSEEDLRAFVAGQNPGGVMISPEEVADTTLDLLLGDHGGRVVELLGGGQREVDEGMRVTRKEPV